MHGETLKIAKCMFKFRHQKAGQNHNPKAANTTFHNIVKVK